MLANSLSLRQQKGGPGVDPLINGVISYFTHIYIYINEYMAGNKWVTGIISAL